MGDEMNPFTGKGILICKNTGEMIDIGKIKISELHLSEERHEGDNMSLNTPTLFGGEQKTYWFKAKVSKRKLRKFAYSISWPFQKKKRKYYNKRYVADLIQIIMLAHGLKPVPPVEYLVGMTRKELDKRLRKVHYNADLKYAKAVIGVQEGGEDEH